MSVEVHRRRLIFALYASYTVLKFVKVLWVLPFYFWLVNTGLCLFNWIQSVNKSFVSDILIYKGCENEWQKLGVATVSVNRSM